MSFGDFANIVQSFGPPGLVIAYLLWERYSRDRRDEKREEARAAQEKDRIAADLELARSLVLLSAKVEHVRAL